jgi:hypothetical protein
LACFPKMKVVSPTRRTIPSENLMPATEDAPLSANQRCMLALALACDLQISKPSERQALRERHKKIKSHQDAAAYSGCTPKNPTAGR